MLEVWNEFCFVTKGGNIVWRYKKTISYLFSYTVCTFIFLQPSSEFVYKIDLSTGL